MQIEREMLAAQKTGMEKAAHELQQQMVAAMKAQVAQMVSEEQRARAYQFQEEELPRFGRCQGFVVRAVASSVDSAPLQGPKTIWDRSAGLTGQPDPQSRVTRVSDSDPADRITETHR